MLLERRKEQRMKQEMRISKYKISFVMAEKDLMQKDVAELAGMSRGNLSNLINGKNCRPRTAFKIAKALGVDVSEILEG
jgi:Plasmid maintenance system antidote protein